MEIFQESPGKPVPECLCFIGAKDDGGGGDNWSYNKCKAPVQSSPPIVTTNNYNTTCNVQLFTGRMPHLRHT